MGVLRSAWSCQLSRRFKDGLVPLSDRRNELNFFEEKQEKKLWIIFGEDQEHRNTFDNFPEMFPVSILSLQTQICELAHMLKV